MMDHDLFFCEEASCWLGQGIITFSMTNDALPFYARWTISPKSIDDIYCRQEIEIDGIMDKMENTLHLYNFDNNKFIITVENEVWGRVQGAGLLEEKTIAWEFRMQSSGFEGMEIYEKISSKQYALHSEYMSPDHYRTNIKGELWKK